MSAARAFLNPAKKRSNLRVITNAHVTQITFDQLCATGICYKLGGPMKMRGEYKPENS